MLAFWSWMQCAEARESALCCLAPHYFPTQTRTAAARQQPSPQSGERARKGGSVTVTLQLAAREALTAKAFIRLLSSRPSSPSLRLHFTSPYLTSFRPRRHIYRPDRKSPSTLATSCCTIRVQVGVELRARTATAPSRFKASTTGIVANATRGRPRANLASLHLQPLEAALCSWYPRVSSDPPHEPVTTPAASGKVDRPWHALHALLFRHQSDDDRSARQPRCGSACSEADACF